MYADIHYVSSDKDDHFSGALAQNAIENESINLPTDFQTCVINKIRIKEITIQSDQQLDWDLVLYSTSAYTETDLDDDKVVSVISFTNGEQIAGANQYYYRYPLSQDIDYYDADHDSKIHCGLVNRSVVSKNSGATGEVKVTFKICPIR